MYWICRYWLDENRNMMISRSSERSGADYYLIIYMLFDIPSKFANIGFVGIYLIKIEIWWLVEVLEDPVLIIIW